MVRGLYYCEVGWFKNYWYVQPRRRPWGSWSHPEEHRPWLPAQPCSCRQRQHPSSGAQTHSLQLHACWFHPRTCWSTRQFHQYISKLCWVYVMSSDHVVKTLTLSWSLQPGPACSSALPPAWPSHCPVHRAVCAGWRCRPRTCHRCWSGWWSGPAGGSILSPASCSAAPGSEPVETRYQER